MNTSHLLTLQKESRLSPEQLAKHLGISNMTVRRWIKKSPSHKLPVFYDHCFQDAVCALIVEGKLSADGEIAQAVHRQNQFQSVGLALKSLNISEECLFGPPHTSENERLLTALTQIASDQKKISFVKKNLERITQFSKKSGQWAEYIKTLQTAIFSKKLEMHEKLIAYGSFFYLLCPLDLVSDFIPAVGYLDDLAILGIASSFLAGKLTNQNKK